MEVEEKRLWAAVLIQALKDVTGFNHYDERKRIRLQYFARVWFESSNRDIGSFVWTCQQLEIHPSWIRGRMRTFLESDRMKSGKRHFTAENVERFLSSADSYTLECASDLLSA